MGAENTLFKDIGIGFESEVIWLPLVKIAPMKIIPSVVIDSEKFKRILASIREVGVIEPPVVAPRKRGQETYHLLDGHLRIEALRSLGETEVMCLVSTDDESYTYNKHINRMFTVQEHRMIVEAIKRGVSEERIASALNVNVSSIIKKRDLLEGICPEAVELLKDKMVSGNVFSLLRRMKAIRQIEVATLMSDSNNYTISYTKALLAATSRHQLVNPEKPQKIKGLDEEQIARMEAEMSSLQGEYRLIEESYGPNVLNLTVARGYLSSLLDNSQVTKYLKQHHPEFLVQFQKIAAMTSLGGEDS